MIFGAYDKWWQFSEDIKFPQRQAIKLQMIEPNKKKVVYLLVGAKGSGKTHIGSLLERVLNIQFLKVEQRLIEYIGSTESKSEQLPNDGYDLEEKWIGEILQYRDEVISEATGSSKYLLRFIHRLGSKYILKLIRINCPLDICFERVKKRGATDHFNVQDDKIRSINASSHNVQLDWDLEIDNAGPATESEIVNVFNNIRLESHA